MVALLSNSTLGVIEKVRPLPVSVHVFPLHNGSVPCKMTAGILFRTCPQLEATNGFCCLHFGKPNKRDDKKRS